MTSKLVLTDTKPEDPILWQRGKFSSQGTFLWSAVRQSHVDEYIAQGLAHILLQEMLDFDVKLDAWNGD